MIRLSLTVAQALITFLDNQYVHRDGKEHKFISGCFGIFGHGNVAGIGQALNEYRQLRYVPFRNEQAMVHAAVAYARVKNRMSVMACTSSIGPGATNMVTGAALATINRIPVLLLPGDMFSRRTVNPVLQQLEHEHTQDLSVNDCFKPVSRYWDRINRPEQLIPSMMEAMRVMTSPSDTGAVTISLPQDVQTEAFDFPQDFLEKRTWAISRNRPDKEAIRKSAQWIRQSKRPLVIAGGGVKYSEATEVLRIFAEQTGIPVAETMAGKGSLPYNHPCCVGGIGVTGTPGAITIAGEADLVIGIGTRYTDFTTSSNTLFRDPKVRFININVAEWDAHKKSALALIGDARACLGELIAALAGYSVENAYRQLSLKINRDWDQKVSDIYQLKYDNLTQGEIIGVVNERSDPDDIMVCASGSLPGDLHKVWRSRSVSNFHMEYGYSCMGYEIAGGLGAKMARPESDVLILVGDGSYLMMAQEILTAAQEELKLIIVLINNHGYKSIGALSRYLGEDGFGTRLAKREDGNIADDLKKPNPSFLPIDFVKNAESMGLKVYRALSRETLAEALKEAKNHDGSVMIYTECDRYQEIDGYSWWDVPVAEVSQSAKVKQARKAYEDQIKAQRHYL